MPAPDPARPAFEVTRRVDEADLDAQADPPHVNNVVYVRWVQEAATAHWEALTTPETRDAVGWVLLRHEIDYRRPAGRGDEVRVRTAVAHLEGLTFERHTVVRRAGDGAVLAESRTLWCPIDRRTGRPRRVSAELRALFSLPTSPTPAPDAAR